MKIGILTSHTPYNFGANLQAFASSQYLLSLGHDVKIIHYKPIEKTEIYKKKTQEVQWSAHEDFIDKRLPLTGIATNEKELIEVVSDEKFDGIIVGADAVWSIPSLMTTIPIFFMNWLFEDKLISNIPVASMSVAHMGKGFLHISDDKRGKIRKSIDQFKFISVRDEWTQKVVNCHLFGGSEKVRALNPDPVFTVDDFIQDAWDNKGIVKENQKFILITLNKDSFGLRKWLAVFRELANRNGYLVGELALPEGVSGLEFDFVVPYPITPIQWYLWLKNANAFVGLRFHSIVSCITAGTYFFSIDRYGSTALLVKIINKLGLYKLGRAFDDKSKIYNLLKNTNFEKNRVHGNIGSIPPRKVFKQLMAIEQEDLSLMRQKLSDIYKINIDLILNEFKKAAN